MTPCLHCAKSVSPCVDPTDCGNRLLHRTATVTPSLDIAINSASLSVGISRQDWLRAVLKLATQNHQYRSPKFRIEADRLLGKP